MKQQIIGKIFHFIGILFIAGIIQSCEDDQIIIVNETINISQAQFTFSNIGDEKCNVKVSVEPVQSWDIDIESGSDWLLVDSKEENSITFATKGKNTTGENLQATVKISTTTGRVIRTLVFTQNHASEFLTDETIEQIILQKRFRYLEGYTNAAMSPNGRYVGLIKTTLVGEQWANDIQVYDSFKGVFYLLDGPFLSSSTIPRGVADNGTILVYHENPDIVINGIKTEETTAAYTLDGEKIIPKLPPAHSEWGKYNQINGLNISGDGNVIIGLAYVLGRDSYLGNANPFKWVNGEPELLPSPKTMITGIREVEPIEVCWPRGSSHDGSVIYGTLWGNMIWTVPVVWKDGEVSYVGEDFAEWNDETGSLDPWWDWRMAYTGPYLLAESNCISPNGRYIVCEAYNMSGILVYDTNTNSSEIINTSYNSPVCIVDDKTISLVEEMGRDGSIVDAAGVTISISQYIQSIVGTDFFYAFGGLFIPHITNNHDAFLASFRDENAYRYVHLAPEGAGRW